SVRRSCLVRRPRRQPAIAKRRSPTDASLRCARWRACLKKPPARAAFFFIGGCACLLSIVIGALRRRLSLCSSFSRKRITLALRLRLLFLLVIPAKAGIAWDAALAVFFSDVIPAKAGIHFDLALLSCLALEPELPLSLRAIG